MNQYSAEYVLETGNRSAVKVWVDGAYLFVFFFGEGKTVRFHEKECHFNSDHPLELELACNDSRKGLLVFEQEGFLDRFAETKTKFVRPTEKFFGSFFVIFLLATGTLAILTYFVFIPGISTFLAERFPMDWERNLAASHVESIAKSGKQCEAPEAEKFMVLLANSIAPQTEYEWQIKLLNDDTANAFALPAGYLFVHTGLVQSVAKSEEFIGVLAHEMAHVLLKHNLRLMVQQNFLAFVISFFGFDSLPGNLTDKIGGLKYSRDIETEADEYAVDLLLNANLSPLGLLSFFHSLEKQSSGSEPPALLSTHPASEERVNHLREYMAAKGVSAHGGNLPEKQSWKNFVENAQACSS